MKQPHPSGRRPARSRRKRGFTLAELLVAISIIGVLAALALVSYRKYFNSARMSEPVATLQAIRTSQESVRRETGRYLNVSVSNTYYPVTNNFGKTKSAWQMPGHPDYAGWRMLEVQAETPARFGYKVNAGRAGEAIATSIEYSPLPALPTPPSDEWFVAQAKGDPNEDGVPTLLLTFSFSTGLFYREE